MSPFLRILNQTTDRPVALRVRFAARRIERLRGLIGHPPLRMGEGLLLAPCRGVHTFGMRHPIDVLALDGGGWVLRSWRALPPRRLTGLLRRGAAVLELPVGAIDASGTREGHRLAWEGAA